MDSKVAVILTSSMAKRKYSMTPPQKKNKQQQQQHNNNTYLDTQLIVPSYLQVDYWKYIVFIVSRIQPNLI